MSTEASKKRFLNVQENFPADLLPVFSAITLFGLPLSARNMVAPNNLEERLERGEVIVGLKDEGPVKFVTGSVLINEPPEKVWPIMVNPFEFRGRISPRMKEVEVMKDSADVSVLKVTLDVIVIPHFTYVVESRYENSERVDFHRIGGTLKDFKGYWAMNPAHNGTQTQLTYSMYIDPGFPVPQWIIREGVKSELPKTLLALRKRVNEVYEKSEKPGFAHNSSGLSQSRSRTPSSRHQFNNSGISSINDRLS